MAVLLTSSSLSLNILCVVNVIAICSVDECTHSFKVSIYSSSSTMGLTFTQFYCSDHTRHFSNHCDINKYVAKVAHGN